jgi:hypothetical protein
LIVSVPLRAPPAVGVKVTVTAQLIVDESGAVVTQVVPLASTAKSPEPVILVNVRLALPPFVIVTFWLLLLVPAS